MDKLADWKKISRELAIECAVCREAIAKSARSSANIKCTKVKNQTPLFTLVHPIYIQLLCRLTSTVDPTLSRSIYHNIILIV